MFFVGSYPLTVDAKSRVSVPFQVRDRMMGGEQEGRAFYVLPGRRAGTLMLFPNRYFEQSRPSRFATDRMSDAAFEWTQFEYSQSVLLEPDSQGRVLIPDRLLKRAGIGREVALVGVHDHLELWDRAAFERFEEESWQAYAERRESALSELRDIGALPNPGEGSPGLAAAESE